MTTGKTSEKNPKEKYNEKDFEILKKMSFIRKGIQKAKKKK